MNPSLSRVAQVVVRVVAHMNRKKKVLSLMLGRLLKMFGPFLKLFSSVPDFISYLTSDVLLAQIRYHFNLLVSLSASFNRLMSAVCETA